MLRLDRVTQWDLRLCQRVNHICRSGLWRTLFRGASVLGDAIAWYALMALLLVFYRDAAVVPVLHMICTGLTCTAGYKLLKGRAHRPRPYQAHAEIEQFAAPLDRFSFPSGHTLHAVAFSWVALNYFPSLAWVLVPFTLMIAASRVVLGLHYPSDVLAGAVLGAATAAISFALAG